MGAVIRERESYKLRLNARPRMGKRKTLALWCDIAVQCIPLTPSRDTPRDPDSPRERSIALLRSNRSGGRAGGCRTSSSNMTPLCSSMLSRCSKNDHRRFMVSYSAFCCIVFFINNNIIIIIACTCTCTYVYALASAHPPRSRNADDVLA